MLKQTLPHGFWPSPLTPTMLSDRTRLEDLCFDSDGETLVWLEKRAGRSALVAQRGIDAPREISGGLKIAAGVGYGGGDFTVRNGLAVFASGGRLYRVGLSSGAPWPFTPAFGDPAAPVIAPDGSGVLFVHTYEGSDCLAWAALDGKGWPVRLASGADFYMQPAWHPDSQRLAWVEWDHPQMPWDGTRLMMARLANGVLTDVTQLFGDVETPVFQPEFSADGRFLAFLANDGEWDTLYTLDLATGEKRVLAKDASLMEPAWIQGMRTFAWSADSTRIFYLQNDRGWRTLRVVNVHTGASRVLGAGPYTWMVQLVAAPVGERIAFIGSSSKIPDRIVLYENDSLRVARRSEPEMIQPDELPEVIPIEWPAPDGTPVYGLYYAPVSTRFTCDGLPPLILHIHGGPTSSRTASYNRDAVFYTTRGYAYFELNHRGSTGYGRTFMKLLRGQWGKLDVEDTLGALKALSRQGLADPARAAVIGESAGGYTVMNCLVRHPGVFKTGINAYGVTNLFDIVVGTHKFEQHYNDSLVGVLPRDVERFREWSPALHADLVRDPVAVFQGAVDKVVPPEHSEQIVAALRANHVQHLYKLYEGEGHGWRKPETIIDYYETIERFLKQYLLF